MKKKYNSYVFYIINKIILQLGIIIYWIAEALVVEFIGLFMKQFKNKFNIFIIFLLLLVLGVSYYFYFTINELLINWEITAIENSTISLDDDHYITSRDKQINYNIENCLNHLENVERAVLPCEKFFDKLYN